MTTSKAWALVVVGYSALAAAMVTFLTINGEPSTAIGTIGTAGLIGLGLVLPAFGMLRLARQIDPSRRAAMLGPVLLSLSLIGLLIGLLVGFVTSSFLGHVISAVFIVPSGIVGLVGAIHLSRGGGGVHIIIGSGLIAAGAALIPAADIALQQYVISELAKNVYQDIGATLAACGCIVTVYSYVLLRSGGFARSPAER